jgi:hypothetical protein
MGLFCVTLCFSSILLLIVTCPYLALYWDKIPWKFCLGTCTPLNWGYLLRTLAVPKPFGILPAIKNDWRSLAGGQFLSQYLLCCEPVINSLLLTIACNTRQQQQHQIFLILTKTTTKQKTLADIAIYIYNIDLIK